MLLLKYTIILLEAIIILAKDPGSEGVTEVDKLPHGNAIAKPEDVTKQIKNITGTTIAPITTDFTIIPITNGSKPSSTTVTPAPTKPSSSSPTVTTPITTTTTTPPSPTPTITPISTTPHTTTVAPKPDPGTWIVRENNTICILLQMDIKLDVKVKGVPKDVKIDVPTDRVKVNGTCGKNNQSLTLTWDENTITFGFKSNETLDKYFLGSVAVNLTAGVNKINLSNDDIVMFETSLKHSYVCQYSNPLKLHDINDTKSVEFSFGNISLDAFKTDNTTSFLDLYICPPDTPDIVPIVVGCALAVLVIVVLITYLVGRRRTQARGYLSM